jgi:hypothetical protein
MQPWWHLDDGGAPAAGERLASRALRAALLGTTYLFSLVSGCFRGKVHRTAASPGAVYRRYMMQEYRSRLVAYRSPVTRALLIVCRTKD